MRQISDEMERVANYWGTEVIATDRLLGPTEIVKEYTYKRHRENKPRAATFARKVYKYISKHPGATTGMMKKALKLKSATPLHAALYKGKRSGYFLHNGLNDWRIKTTEPAQLQ